MAGMLLENKNKTVARERLLIGVWGYDYEGSDRCVDNHIRKIRKHLGSAGKQIKTVIGNGYQIRGDDDEKECCSRNVGRSRFVSSGIFIKGTGIRCHRSHNADMAGRCNRNR